jgi:hypothetical protein
MASKKYAEALADYQAALQIPVTLQEAAGRCERPQERDLLLDRQCV